MSILLKDYDFEFPQELIAQVTAGKGKTQILSCSRSSDHTEIINAAQMVDLFKPGDCLVVNNTKVIPARLFGERASGAPLEILLIEPRIQAKSICWEAWVKPGKAFQVGKTLNIAGVETKVIEILSDGARILEFNTDQTSFESLLEESGKIPLPPYITRPSDDRDKHDYQSIFAEHAGAVAAPTASLHFSEEMMQALLQKGVLKAEVTLHVGPGTFQNVSAEDATMHHMHSEAFELLPTEAQKINQAKKAGGRIISVGTTTTRVLETCADAQGLLQSRSGRTDIFIYPGYHWKCVDGLLTNFHWPKSTLVLLVASFYGREKTLQAYAKAVANQMQLFSYGDGMLIMP
jgi:S-adenosylmethionine:tRNA ribosyltransferase-isomerase